MNQRRSQAATSTMQQTQQRPTMQQTLNNQTVTSRLFEQRMDKRIQADRQHEILQNYHKHNQLYSSTNASDERVDTLRRLRKFQQQNQELQQAYQYENAKKEAEQRKMLAEQDAQVTKHRRN